MGRNLILVIQHGRYVPSLISFAIKLRLALGSVNGLVASRRFLTLSSCLVGPMSGTRRLGSVILPDLLGVDSIGSLRLASLNIFRMAKSKLSESWFSMVWMIFGEGIFGLYWVALVWSGHVPICLPISS